MDDLGLEGQRLLSFYILGSPVSMSISMGRKLLQAHTTQLGGQLQRFPPSSPHSQQDFTCSPAFSPNCYPIRFGVHPAVRHLSIGCYYRSKVPNLWQIDGNASFWELPSLDCPDLSSPGVPYHCSGCINVQLYRSVILTYRQRIGSEDATDKAIAKMLRTASPYCI